MMFMFPTAQTQLAQGTMLGNRVREELDLDLILNIEYYT
jgi:hypothetical protein